MLAADAQTQVGVGCAAVMGSHLNQLANADLMAVSEKPILTFTIDFETAKRYRKANKMPHQFRRAAWTDLTVEVYL